MTLDSNTANQQEVETVIQQPEPKPEDNRVIKCAMHMTLVDGNQFSTEMLIPVKNYDHVRENMATSMTNQKGEGILTLSGSVKSQYDWAHIPVKSIIMTNMNFIEMVEEKQESDTTLI